MWGLRQAASLYRAQEVICPSEIFPLFRLFETGRGDFPSLHSGKGKGETLAVHGHFFPMARTAAARPIHIVASVTRCR